MKIFVLGSTGMLGRYVERYLNKFFNVVSLNREKLDASKVNQETLLSILKKEMVSRGDVIINCMGTIKPRVDQLGDLIYTFSLGFVIQGKGRKLVILQ